jgi:tagatose 6-phosphate kinase
MIAVAGFNTAIDRLLSIDALEPGQVRRVRTVQVTPGGKGVHVAQTIAALGEPVRLVGLVDQAYRDFIADGLRARGVLFHGVTMRHPLRTCMAIREADGRITELLESGPLLDESEQAALLDAFHASLDGSDAVVLTGSLPGGLVDDTYAALVRGIDQSVMPCLVDASGPALRHATDAVPYLLKPNRDEAAELAGHPLDTPEDAARLVRELVGRGIARPIVTLGAQGAVGGDGDAVWHASLAIVASRNAVGSGDCFLGGVAVGLRRTGDIADALRLGVACGAANATTEETGFIELATVQALQPQVRLRRLDS